MNNNKLKDIINYINSSSPESKIYIGCDSVRFKRKNKWYADYTLVVVIHIDGCHGCKIFGYTSTERDYELKNNKPNYRLMNEVYKVSELYTKIISSINNRDIEIHLDINSNEKHASSGIVNQAIGYIKGTCNQIPKIKPEAFAASYAADRFKSL